MRVVPVAVIALLAGLGLCFALDELWGDQGAAWPLERQMRGCWASGADRLLVRQGDRRLRFLEARSGGDPWVRLDTRPDDDEVVASPSGGQGRLRMSSEADRLVSIGFPGVPDAEWVRCEAMDGPPGSAASG